MKKRGRRRYVVKKGMQFRLTARFVVLTLLFSLFMVFEAYITVWPVVAAFIPERLMHIVVSQIYFRALCFVIPVFFVIVAFSLVFSHRIAGPIHRLERLMDKLVQGEPVKHMRLRKHDELSGLVQRINRLIDKMDAQARVAEKVSFPED